MADSQINIKIVLNEDGSLKKASTNLDKVSKSEKKLEKQRKKTKQSTDQATKAHSKYDKQNKSVYQGNLSASKGFSKMKETIGGGSSGLVQAYATLAANVFAATAAFTALKSASQVDTLISSLENLGAASGKNLQLLATQIRDAAGGAIDLAQALRTASVGASAGFDSTQIAGLAEVATAAAKALGRDVGDAVDRLTRGAAKLEPEILDELGIFVRLDDASAKYAASLGVAASELTRFQQRQAFTNEILEQGSRKFAAMGEGVEASPYDQLAATLGDLSRTFMNFFNSVLSPLAGFFAENTVALAGFFAIITKGILNQALPVLNQFSKTAEMAAKRELERANVQQLRIDREIKSQRAVLKPIKNSELAYNKLFGKIKQGTFTTQDLKDAEASLALSIKRRQEALKTGSAATLATRQKELNFVKQQQKEVQKLINLEQARAGKAGAIQIAGATAKGKRSEQAVFRELDKDQSFKGYMRAFGLADLASKKYKKNLGDATNSTKIFGMNLGFLGKALNGARVPFYKFGLTGKIAIKGLFTAIPVIGQLLLVFDLLIVALKKAINFFAGFKREASELTKANRQLADSVKFYTETQSDARKQEETRFQFLQRSANATQGLIDSTKNQADATKDAYEEAGIFGQMIIIIGRKFEVFGMKAANAFAPITIGFSNMVLGFEQGWLKFMNFITPALNLMIRLFNRLFAEAGEEIALISEADKDANIKRIEEIEKTMNDKFKTRALTTLSNDSINLLGDLAATSAEVQSLGKVLGSAGPEAKELQDFLGTNDINVFVSNLKNATDVSELLQGGLKTLATEVDKEGKATKTAALIQSKFADGVITAQEAIELFNLSLNQGTKNSRESGQAVEELGNVFVNSGEKFAEFFTAFRKKAPFGPILQELKNVDELVGSITTGEGGAAAFAEQFEQAPAALKNVIDNGLKLQGVLDENGKLVESNGLTEEEILKRIGELRQQEIKDTRALVAEIVKAQLFDNARLQILQQQAAAVKKAGSQNAAGIKAGIALSNAQANINISRLQNENKLREKDLKLQAGEVLTEEELAKLSSEQQEKYASLLENRVALGKEQEKLVGDVEKQALIDKALLEQSKLRLTLFKEQATTSALVTKNLNAQANSAKGLGRGQSPRQQLAAAKEAAKVATQAAQKELELLEEKFRVEALILEARLEAAGVEDIRIKEIITALNDQLDLEKQISQEKIKQAQENEKSVGADRFTGLLSGTTSMQMMTALDTGIGDIGEATNTQERLEAMSEATKPMRDQLMALGPEGELVAIAQQGIMTLASAFDLFYSAADPGDRLAAVGAAIGAVSEIMAANSKAQIAEIDRQIAAEQKRDGKSKESLAKIQAMEKKKDQMARKAFEQNKKMQMASTIVNTAAAVVKTLNDPTIPETFTRVALATMIGALGMAQLAVISKTQYQSSLGSMEAPKATALNIGKRSNAVNVAKGATGGELNYLRGGQTSGQNIGGAGASFPGGAMGRRGYADGGIVVGERGPEVITPTQQIDVTPNYALEGGNSNVNFTINAVDAAGVEDVLMNQRGNIIRMIREAANENGTMFLEEIDTQAYGSSK